MRGRHVRVRAQQLRHHQELQRVGHLAPLAWGLRQAAREVTVLPRRLPPKKRLLDQDLHSTGASACVWPLAISREQDQQRQQRKQLLEASARWRTAAVLAADRRQQTYPISALQTKGRACGLQRAGPSNAHPGLPAAVNKGAPICIARRLSAILRPRARRVRAKICDRTVGGRFGPDSAPARALPDARARRRKEKTERDLQRGAVRASQLATAR